MKTRTLFLLLTAFIIIPANSNGQVGNLLKNKMGKVISAGARTANKEVDNKIDSAATKETQKQIDKRKAEEEAKAAADAQNNTSQPSAAGSSDESSSAPPSGGFNLGKLMANKVTLKYKDDYSFSSRIYMVSESYDDKDVVTMDFYMFYSASSPSIGVETKSISSKENGTAPVMSSMVMDGENKCFLVLTDLNGMKMGIISPISDETTATDGKKEKQAPPTFKKTGNTKVIVGYKCDEYSYVSESDKTTGKVWFTKDAKLKIDKNGWRNSNMAAYYGNPEFNEGIILANEVYDKKGKLTTKMETKEINENYSHSISIKGYSLRQMNLSGDKK